jgi:integrase
MSAEKWKYAAGARPNTVVVFEREPGGPLYARAWDSAARGGKGNWHRVSLGHRDKARAKRYAIEQAAKLQKGEAEIAEAKVTLAQVLALYLQHRTPRKTPRQQKEDATRVELWTRVLGGGVDPHGITLQRWEAFIDARSAGAIDARGMAVPPGQRKAVRARTVEADCEWLRFVFNWSAKWRLASGRYLMRENPVRGYDVPKEKNVRQPVASSAFYATIREVADRHTMELRKRKPGGGFEPKRVRSYLPELLDIAEGTARRISAICALRYSDLRLQKSNSAPFGAIRWPGDTDKEKREWSAPISPNVRAALNRILTERPAVGSGPLFPSPSDRSVPISRHEAGKWFREAEALAGLDHEEGRGWHSLRRKWASERKHLPDVDVMAAGGWKSLEALKKSYQHADEAGVLAVVMSGAELKEHAQ